MKSKEIKKEPNVVEWLLLYVALLIIRFGRDLIPKAFPTTRNYMFRKIDLRRR
jgi:hypothetical protein